MSSHQFGVLLISGRLTHQENYALNLRADPRCTLVGLTDEKDVPPERAQLNRQFAEDLDIPYWPDLDEALARDDVHVVSICADPERRGRIAARCADAGKHVYVDKPMTPYLSHADAAVAAVERAGVRSQMFSSNHQPWVDEARQVVESGELGELTAIHVDNLFAKGPNGTATLGAPRKAVYPPVISNFVDAKAELYAIGVYALGFVCMISGRAVETVFGSTANYFFEAHQRRNMEDFGFLSLTLEGGVTATITGGQNWLGQPPRRRRKPDPPHRHQRIAVLERQSAESGNLQRRPALDPAGDPSPRSNGLLAHHTGRGKRPTQAHAGPALKCAGKPQRRQLLH